MLLMKKALSPVILMMMPVKVRVRTRVISGAKFASGGRKRGPSQPRCSNAKRKKSPAEVYHTNGKVTAHGLQWKFEADDVSVDAFQENRYKPKLRVADPASMSVLDFWDVFRFLLARALVKSFRKQTQGSNLARNALQRESSTRQLGFFML